MTHSGDDDRIEQLLRADEPVACRECDHDDIAPRRPIEGALRRALRIRPIKPHCPHLIPDAPSSSICGCRNVFHSR